MTPARCPRLFEVEAMRDGRLGGTQLASFQRHVAQCGACLREARALEQLADRLRASPPEDARRSDELHVIRERVRLLAAFDRALMAPGARIGAWRRARWPLAIAALAAACVLVSRRVRPTTVPARTASAVVRAGAGAVWSQRTNGRRDEIVLVRGALSIRVDHAARGAGSGQLVVLLPDGELEDTGTTFTVSADGGATTQVAVQEGSVVLRIRKRPAVTIGAGGTWMRDRAPLTSDVSRAARNPAATARPAATPRRTVATRAATPNGSSVDFRAAMAVLDVGANREAAAAFASFLVRYPRDARAEDAAYLRVIALQRCGADTDMRRAAGEYLRLYPAGFRRVEVEKLSP